MAGLRLKEVSKRFGGALVLDKLSLDIAADEFLVVLGPSGCGKSTLLRIIAGLESIDSGVIEIDGRRVEQLPPGKRGVAMVFQGYALYPHMTVRQNIAFGLVNVGVPRAEIERRVGEVTRMLEMQPLLDRLPAELSGGQRQRVAIGRAIVKQPKLFMFDEPLSNLDAALRIRMRQEIAKLHRRLGTAMIFVTHDQTEAMTLADRIVVMNQQRIEQVGSPLEIYRNPASLFVASFVGSPAMNILPVRRAAYSAQLQRIVLGEGTEIETLIPASSTAEAGDLRLGIRPESLRLSPAGEASLRAKIEFVEFLGDKSHVHLVFSNGDRLVACGEAAFAGRENDVLEVGFDRTALHLFGADGRNCGTRDPVQTAATTACGVTP